MFPFGDVFPVILFNIVRLMFEPLFWLVVLLVAVQYRRINSVREHFYGVPLKPNWNEVVSASMFGLAGGVVGSVIMVLIGVTLTGSGLYYILPLAFLLMLINIRFICFAYAGGILALSNILFGFPEVNASQVLALVAVLHMVESVLILFGGHLGAIPAYFRDGAGRVVGGFTLQKFWPIPITALAFVVGVEIPPEAVDMPDWWPLIGPGVEEAENVVYTLIPLAAALGYGDMAIAREPRRKSVMSAGYLALYSAVLLLLAVLSDASLLLAVAAALFSPLGHELIINIGRRVEMQDPPFYAPSPDGLKVMDVLPGTPAWDAGIRSGDIMVSVNGVPVRSRSDLAAMMYAVYPPLQVDYLSGGQKRYRRETLARIGTEHGLGILPVPDGTETGETVVDMNTTGPLGRWWDKFRQRLQGL
ncbi:MAG: PDZ domain-containing protein [Firmicutes bacterium]|nr:PDZ domain-containing protein [Bacillota bacterium]